MTWVMGMSAHYVTRKNFYKNFQVSNWKCDNILCNLVFWLDSLTREFLTSINRAMPWGIINLQLSDNANELEILLYTIFTMSLVQIRDHSGFNKFIWIYAYKPLYVALALHVHIYMHLFPKEAIQSCSGKQA